MSQSEQKAAPADLAPAPSTALTPIQRAVQALASTQTESDLRALALASADIVAVIDLDGRSQAHRIGMTLKNARIAVEKRGKEAREDAVAFSKAVVAEEKRLVGLVAGEEDRVFGLRDGYDAKVAAEKAEAERIAAEIRAALRSSINTIVTLPARAAGKPSLEIFNMLGQLAARDVTTEGFGDLTDEAVAAVNAAGTELNAMYEKALDAEHAAAEREAAAAIERARVEEQAEANRKESARLAALQREAEAAQAERDRVAAETKRQLEAQAAAIEQKRKDDEAARKAEQDAFDAKVAAFELAQQKELAHADALVWDAAFNMALAAERAEAAQRAAEAVQAAAQQVAEENAATALQTIPETESEPVEQVGAASLDAQEQHLVGAMRTAIWELLAIADETLVRREIEIALADFTLVSA